MARPKSYSRNRKFRGRQIFLTVAFVTVAGLAVWKLLPQARTWWQNQNQNLKNPSDQSSQDPLPITVPPTPDPGADSPRKTPTDTTQQAETVVQQQEKKEPDIPDILKYSGNPSEDAADLTEQAKILYQEGIAALEAQKQVEARDKLSRAIALKLPPDLDKSAHEAINKSSSAWLFSRICYEGDTLCSHYRVVSGDLLSNIGNKYNVPYKLIMRINGIPDERSLRQGKNIKVVRGPFHVIVDRKNFRLSVYLNDIMVRNYPVTIGKPGRETPTGLWVVSLKQVNPAWYDAETNTEYLPDDVNNPLGERWIALEGIEGNALGEEGIGIHGTIAPDKIGTADSRGCIRLHNKNVEELYDMLLVEKSYVRIIN